MVYQSNKPIKEAVHEILSTIDDPENFRFLFNVWYALLSIAEAPDEYREIREFVDQVHEALNS